MGNAVIDPRFALKDPPSGVSKVLLSAQGLGFLLVLVLAVTSAMLWNTITPLVLLLIFGAIKGVSLLRRSGGRALEVRALDSPFWSSMSPRSYEGFCANELRRAGWAVHLTPVVGDQGVDIIAEKRGLRVALQCQLYSKAVGNKAVQEITAGRYHHNAQFGAVVTNSRFTPAARQLASSNRIFLLHHQDLSRIEALLSRG